MFNNHASDLLDVREKRVLYLVVYGGRDTQRVTVYQFGCYVEAEEIQL